MPKHFSKCFIGFRAINRLSERRYSYQSTEHTIFHCRMSYYVTSIKNAPLLQDTFDGLFAFTNIHRKPNNELKRRSLCVCAYLNLGCSSPRAYNILASVQRSVVRSTKCHSIFQNVSSAFARFIGKAKADIRISQLNTSISRSHQKCPIYFINKKCPATAGHLCLIICLSTNIH